MLATTTHDTKRSEDGRARINVLSEIADAWQTALVQWRRTNEPNRTRLRGGQAPDANDEYLFYQSLLGAWPAEPGNAPVPQEATQSFVERIKSYMLKAVREAKTHTSWLNQNRAYEDAVALFKKAGVDTVFENLEGFPADWKTNPDAFVKFVRAHQCPSFLEYGEYPYVSTDEIKKALELKNAFSRMLEQMQ